MNTKPLITLTWKQQNEIGRQLALTAIGRCIADENPTLLLRDFERDITADTTRGITVGFFHQLAESLIQGIAVIAEPQSLRGQPMSPISDPVQNLLLRLLQEKRPVQQTETLRLPAGTEEPNRLIRIPEVVHRVGLSRPTIYRKIKDGSFPAPVHQGRTSCWPLGVIVDYLTKVAGDEERGGQ